MPERLTPRDVVIADDHPMYRSGVERAIRDDERLSLVAATDDGAEALRLIMELQPAVALLDVRMPTMTGTEVVSELVRRRCSSAVVLLSAFSDPESVHAAISAGARGYLTKDSTDAEICDALIRVARGGVSIADSLHVAVVGAMQAVPKIPLSTREREVLTMVAEGRTNAAIGRSLSLSPATVKTYLSRIFEKLEAADRAAAVAAALRRGIIE